MGFKLALFLIQVLTVKHVFSYPARDYILAYIPIEEYVYYTPAIELIELVPVTSYYVAYPDSYNVRYYDGQYSSRRSTTPLTSGSFSVCCSSTPLPVSQPSIIETSTVLSIPAVPEMVLPSVPEMVVPNVPEAIVPSVPEVVVPSVPAEFATPVLPIEETNEAQFVANTVVEPLLLPETAYVSATTPVAGKVTFSGALPAYGSIRICASCY